MTSWQERLTQAVYGASALLAIGVHPYFFVHTGRTPSLWELTVCACCVGIFGLGARFGAAPSRRVRGLIGGLTVLLVVTTVAHFARR